MIDIEYIAQKRHTSQEELIEELEDFFEKMQVLLANLEEAIERSEYQKIIETADTISHLCAKFYLFEIAKESEHLEVLATFKRKEGYMPIFESLYKKSEEAYYTFKSQVYAFCR